MKLVLVVWGDSTGSGRGDHGDCHRRFEETHVLWEREVEVRNVTTTTTVGDLTEVLAAGSLDGLADCGPAAGAAVRVDGRPVAPSDLLANAGVVSGCTFEVVTADRTRPPSDDGDSAASSDVAFSVTGGLDVGWSFPVVLGRQTIGSSRASAIVVDDPAMSPVHALLRSGAGGVQIVDLGSDSGTSVNGIPVSVAGLTIGDRVRMGSSELTLVSRAPIHEDIDVDHAGTWDDGLVVFNRAPRSITVETAPDISVPEPVGPRPVSGHLSIVSVVAPLVMAAAMVLITGSLRYALFALVSPVTMVGNAVANRRRQRKQARLRRREFDTSVRAFESALASAAANERSRAERHLPSIAETIDLAVTSSSRLWERRRQDDSFLWLRVGVGSVEWQPPVDVDRGSVTDELQSILDAAGRIDDCPVGVDLGEGKCVGLVGDRPAVLATARAMLVQAAVLHGPADVAFTIEAGEDRLSDWDWVKWLPHLSATSTRSRSAEASGFEADPSGVGFGRTGSEAIATPHPLVIVDDESLVVGREQLVRRLLRGDSGPASVLMLASSESKLPSEATTIVRLVGRSGAVRVETVDGSNASGNVMGSGIGEPIARRAARALARFDDPELDAGRSSLPRSVSFSELVESELPGAREILERWEASAAQPGLPAVVGVGSNGTFQLDLVADGPHGLVAGTTGAGKSELLRTMVVSLASGSSPSEVAFVLIDYKGGSAFAECQRLPHTVGMVTDLDDHLARRALVSLEAEIRHREELLADAGARDIGDYRRAGSLSGDMPRLVIVVDEFAALATELPDFLEALVSVAQRGRSLGLHLILATQRPAGVVSSQIKANTNLRIALRTQDGSESVDIVGSAAAAYIDRSAPGRALVRRGEGETELVQVASVSISVKDRRQILVSDFELESRLHSAVGGGDDAANPEALRNLVDAIAEACVQSDTPLPAAPWMPPLPDEIGLEELLQSEAEPMTNTEASVPLALADFPGRRTIEPVMWQASAGNIGVFGSGPDATDAGRTVAVSAATVFPPAGLHIYGLEWSPGRLQSLLDLAHVGAVVCATEIERVERLVGLLGAEIDGRRGALGRLSKESDVATLLVVEGLDRFLADEQLAEAGCTTGFEKVLAEGPSVGIASVASLDRLGAIPSRVLAHLPTRFLFGHPDPNEFASAGLRASDLPTFVPGRAIRAADGAVCQFPSADGVAEIVDRANCRWADSVSTVDRIEPLPFRVDASRLSDLASDTPAHMIPVGVSAGSRQVAHLDVRAGTHALVAGPAESGVSTALTLIAAMARCVDPDLIVVAVGTEGSGILDSSVGFDASGSIAELDHVLETASADSARRWLVLVDDAHRVQLTPGLDAVLAGSITCSVIAGGVADQLHGRFDHWTRAVRRSNVGLLLRPRLGTDGDLLGVRLPRRSGVPPAPGRGFLVRAGAAELVQLAFPTEDVDSVAA